MSIVGKHRGWLLVYEIQYWVMLAVSVLAFMFLPTLSASLIIGILLVIAFWGIPIWALYGSTDAVRRGHIIWCWLLAAVTASMLFTDPPSAANPAARLGEFLGGAFLPALWIAWALYWHNSKRVKNSYPARDQKTEA